MMCMERTLSTVSSRACHANERSPYELDSLEVAQLLTLRDAGNTRTAVWVGNLLCAAYGHCTPPLTGGDGLAKARRRVAIAEPQQPVAAARLHIAPNPASSAVQLAYLLKDQPVDAWLTVTDPAGRTIQRMRIMQKEGSLSWGIQSLASGVYAVGITEKGALVLSERLVIQR